MSTFRDSSRIMDFDGLCLCFYFGSECCLCAVFYSLNGTSILESVCSGLRACLNDSRYRHWHHMFIKVGKFRQAIIFKIYTSYIAKVYNMKRL